MSARHGTLDERLTREDREALAVAVAVALRQEAQGRISPEDASLLTVWVACRLLDVSEAEVGRRMGYTQATASRTLRGSRRISEVEHTLLHLAVRTPAEEMATIRRRIGHLTSLGEIDLARLEPVARAAEEEER